MLSPRDYDEAITMFSPEGRLYQVEYALEMVKRGSPIVGLSSEEGAVLVASEISQSRLEDNSIFRKIFQLDNHVGAAIAGLSSDARSLINQARLTCQSNKLLYDEPVEIESLALSISDLLQMYTQNAGVRPFGVSMIIAGVDSTGCKVFTTDPAGSYRGYSAISVGQRSEETNKFLATIYRDDLSLDEAVAFAIEAVKTASEGKTTVVKAAVIPSKTKSFRRLTPEEITKYIK